MPLFQLLDSIIQLCLIGGAILGTLGFVIAGLCYIIPGEDLTQRGKQIAKGTLIGVIILFSAQMMMAFLTSQLGGVICG